MFSSQKSKNTSQTVNEKIHNTVIKKEVNIEYTNGLIQKGEVVFPN